MPRKNNLYDRTYGRTTGVLKRPHKEHQIIYIGIDPGKKGAICFYHYMDDPELVFYDWPKDDNIENIASILAACMKLKEVRVILEKVSAMPKQGVTSMFNFGRNFGQWIGILQTLKIPYHLMTPQAWRKGLVYPSDGDPKQASLKAFCRLFPRYRESIYGSKGGLKDGRMDAALMAYKAKLLESGDE